MINLNDLPSFVRKVCTSHGCWIAGSAAHPQALITSIEDIDVVCSYAIWDTVAQLIPPNARINSFGGWKFKQNGLLIDVWPSDLGIILARAKCTNIWHPASNKRFTTVG